MARVADPLHFDADPDQTFPLWCGSGSCSSSKWCESPTTGAQALQDSTLSLHASTVGVHGPPRLHFEPLRNLIDVTVNSVADPQHFDANLDPACYFDADPDSDPIFHFHADPDPDPSFQIQAQNLEKVLQKIGSYSIHFALSSANWCGSKSIVSLWCGSRSN